MVARSVFMGNTKRVQNQIAKSLASKEAIAKAMAISVEMVRTSAIESIMRGSKTGTTYTKYNPRRTHTASAEGEAPASDTGNLVSGITTNIEKSITGDIVGEVIANARDGKGGNYAKHLEFGTREMRPRPFLFPALEKNKKRILAIFIKHGVRFR